MADPESIPPSRFDVLPIVLLLAAVAVILAAWFLFPALQHYMSQQDCVASGHTNC